LKATSDFSEAAQCDCVCICVPTPLDEHQQPDISYVKASTESLVPYLHEDMLIVLESTTYPGTTEELLRPILEKSGLVCGRDLYLAFSPERVDPGNLIYKKRIPPKLSAGSRRMYGHRRYVIRKCTVRPGASRSSPAIAEMEKILENTYRNINIGLINELAILCIAWESASGK
jgi:UDP-N-acetyl-D-glucosamine dehydrogenase